MNRKTKGTITLTIGDAYYDTNRTIFNGFEAGDLIYLQVDSWALNTGHGSLLETHEIEDLPYNNISGPISPDVASPLSGDQP